MTALKVRDEKSSASAGKATSSKRGRGIEPRSLPRVSRDGTRPGHAQFLPPSPRGNCYVTSEALYYILGGKAAGWKPMHMQWYGESHWFLQHETGLILDATVLQFGDRVQPPPDYSLAKGKGFLTKKPSKETVQMLLAITYGIRFATNIEMEAEYHRGLRAGLNGGVRG